MKNKFWQSSRFWVFLYAFVMAVIMTLQLILGIMQNKELVFKSVTLNNFVNGEVNLPMETLAWCWTALISLFCGFDRFVDIKTTMHLSSGQMSFGDLAKLRAIILVNLVLFIYAVLANFLVDKDFQLTQMAMAFGMSVIIYVSGNKLVKSFKYSGEKDEDGDGIPDSIQEEYEKWVRAQKKNNIDEAYINLDYFLDEREDLKEKLSR